MAEGNSRNGIGDGGLTGPLTDRERRDLFPNDERVDHSGYPRGFAPERGRGTGNNLELGMKLINDPKAALEELERRRREKQGR